MIVRVRIAFTIMLMIEMIVKAGNVKKRHDNHNKEEKTSGKTPHRQEA